MGVAGVYAQYFANTRSAFQQLHSIAGDSESSLPLQPESRGLFKSIDGGATWRNTGFTQNSVNLLVIDPSNALIIYAGSTGPASEATGFRGVFKSTDGGTSWLGINKGLEGLIGSRLTTTTALIVDRANAGILYLGTSNGGVFEASMAAPIGVHSTTAYRTCRFEPWPLPRSLLILCTQERRAACSKSSMNDRW